MRRPQVLYRNFIRVNEVASPEHLEDNELQEALNAIYDEAGGVSKRTGMDVEEQYMDGQAPLAEPITRLIDYSKEGELLVAHGTTLRVLDGSVIADDLDNTDFDTEVFSDGNLYLVNGDKYYSYNGTDLEEVTAASGTSLDHIKRCKYLVQRGERLYAAGDDQNPNTIYYSEIGEANNFPSLNFINALSDDNDVITGLAEFHSAMVAFKRHHIYGWFGWDPESDVRFDKINVHTGTASFRTIRRVYNFLFYLGEDGVYALHGLEPNYISSNNLTDETIKRRFEGLINTSGACAIFHEGKYILSVRTEGTCNNLVLVYDFTRKAWSPWTGWKVSAFLVYDGEFYTGSGEHATVYERSDEYNDAGEPIHYRIKTRPYDCRHPLHDKKFAWFYMLVGEKDEGNEINVTLECDYKTIRMYNGIQLNTVVVPGAFLHDEEAPEGRSRLFYKKARMLARSMRAQVTIENNEVDEGITVYGIGFQFWPIRA